MPWVTFGVMGLCVLVFLVSLGAVSSTNRRGQKKLQEISDYYLRHPDLKLEPDLEDILLGPIPKYQDQREAFKEFLKESTRGAPTGGGEEGQPEAGSQEELDRMTADFHKIQHSLPYYTLGLVPAHQKLLAYITYQFVHAGWAHLFFNMLFLYLLGPYIEDVWGRVLYGGFYLSAGVVAAAYYCFKYPMSEAPLVGASGAIAGVMGAFLIRYGLTKIRFALVIFIKPRFFDAPAWLMLPLWLLIEFSLGQAVDLSGGKGAGVAHWAHVAGFVFGVAVALGVKKLRFEERFETKLDAQSVQHENLGLEEALAARREGRMEEAEQLLLDQLQATPGDYDTAMALWDVRRDLGDVAPAVPHVQRALLDALRKGQADLIEPRWAEFVEMAPDGSIDPLLATRVLETMANELPDHVQRQTVTAAAAAVGASTPSGLLVRLTRLAAQMKAPCVAQLAALALGALDLPPETRTELEALVGGPPQEAPAPEPPPAPVEPAAPAGEAAPSDVQAEEEPEPPPTLAPEDHELEIMETAPVGWDGFTLEIKVGGESRPMGLNQIQAVAVGGIVEAGKTPYVIVDLMLDAPWSKRVKLRVIRLRSNTFDPTALVEGPNPMACFRTMLEDIINNSGAAPLPDPESAAGNPFKKFPSVAAYELEVLGLTS